LYTPENINRDWEVARGFYAGLAGIHADQVYGLEAVRANWERKAWLFPFLDENGHRILSLDKSEEPLNEEDVRTVLNKIKELSVKFSTEDPKYACLRNDRGKGAFDFLSYRIFNSLSTEEVVGNILTSDRQVLPGKDIKKGTKVAKYFKQLIQADDYEWLCGRFINYNREESMDTLVDFINLLYSQLISMVKDRPADQVVLSVNPVEMLMASIHTAGWRSCHAISDPSSHSGTSSYMQDPLSVITYAFREVTRFTLNSFSAMMPRKLWRSMLFFDTKNQSALQSREYPGGMPQYAKAARKLAAFILAEYASVQPKWAVGKLGSQAFSLGRDEMEIRDTRYNINGHGWHYQDTPWAKLQLIPGGNPPDLRPGAEMLACPYCGQLRSPGTGGGVRCRRCRPIKSRCAHCDEDIHDKDAFFFEDHYYCISCRDTYFVPCDHCGDYVRKGDAFKFEDKLYCDNCRRSNFRECASCGQTHPVKQLKEGVDGNFYCDTCWHDRFTECTHCHTGLRKQYAATFGDQSYCDDCYDRLFTFCNDCGEILLRSEAIANSRGWSYCHNCLSECHDCHQQFASSDLTTVGENRVCIECAKSHDVEPCHECGKMHNKAEMKTRGKYHYCTDCLDNCSHCGKEFRVVQLTEQDGQFFCKNCLEEVKQVAVSSERREEVV
jgi:hypothetical protein